MGRKLPEDLLALLGKRIRVGEVDYEVLEYCGSGKRGHVLKAKRTDGRERALKFIGTEKRDAGWEREASKAHLLEHQPNTVRFYYMAFLRHYAVMVFDFIEGRNLRELIEMGDLSVADVEQVLYNLIFFCRDCHRQGVRHGDLHPGNVIFRKPVMGPPRPREVMITDFGIGHTEAVLNPKDDLAQVGIIATRMLQSIRRESLGQSDRAVYDELCRGPVVKRLRETSPLERGDPEVAIDSVLAELSDVRGRAFAPESSPALQTRFGDYLAGEQLGSRWKEWGELFVSGFPGYADIVSQNTTVLTGTRGCGKTIVFRRLSMLLSVRVGPVDEGPAGSLVGFYVNMNDVGDAFVFTKGMSLSEDLARRTIQFFHLCLLAEIVTVAAIAREKAPAERQGVYDKGNKWLFEVIAPQTGPSVLYPGPGSDMRTAATLLEAAKDEVRRSSKPPSQLAALSEIDWLKRFVPELQCRMPWIGDRPVYFFLDDYSLPRVGEAIQTALNSVVLQRSDSFFFKISTESPSTLWRKDYSGKTLDDTHDFDLADLGSLTIDLSHQTREDFLGEVFRRRLAREERFRGHDLAEMLGEFGRTWVDLAKAIQAGERVLYHGRKVFVNMWSGDTRSMVRIAMSLLGTLPEDGELALPIQPERQDKVFRNAGGEFLHLLEACTRTSRYETVSLPGHITSWGKHLVKIAEAFKEIALHELRTRTGGREGRGEPKQAFRIEIVDHFSLAGIEKELYEDLVRYGVFLRDDRGKSIRGAIIPRLYLRRLLIPYCTLTFSKIDNVAMNAYAFRALLVDPEQFAKNWKRERTPYVIRQKELGFEEA